MQMSDPLRFIDWEINKFLRVVLSTQIAAIVLILLGMAGIQMPVIRQAVCFIYLTFIPGALILRALNVHKLAPIQSAMFTVGASLAALMFAGALLNFTGPYLGITAPITILPIMVMLTALVLILSMLCYLRDRKSDDPLLDIKEALSPPALLLYAVPFLAIFGAYRMNFFDANGLLVLMILALAAIVLLVGFDRLIPKELYPLAIFVVAISLLLHNALISTYINGWDIQFENYRAALVLANGFWDSSTFSVLNAMLSIVMLAPIYSIVMDMDIVWVFKLIYPLLFALVPVGLYEVFRRQSSEKIAFMASFFFMSLVVFYTEMLQLARQEIAELFLVLVIMLVLDRSLDKAKWSVLFIIFSFSLVVSHYGLTYIFIASLIIVLALLYLARMVGRMKMREIELNTRLSLVLVVSIVMFCLVWYISIASGNPFDTIVSILDQVFSNAATGFLDPDKVQGLGILATGGSVSALHKIYLYLMLFTQALIVVGIAAVILKKGLMKMSAEYFAFSLVMIVILIAGITVPFFASSLNTTRLYQITLIFLAIFFVAGWLGVSKFLGRLIHRDSPGMPIAFRALAIFLAIFLIFNTGLAFEVFNDVPISYALNSTVDSAVFNTAEVAGANWIVSERSPILIDNQTDKYYMPPIYCDEYRLQLLKGKNADQASNIPDNGTMYEVSYVYMGTFNLQNDLMFVVSGDDLTSHETYVSADDVSKDRGLIYSNGGSEIYNRIF